MHTKSVHEEIKPFKCKGCHYESAEKTNLLRHMESVHEGIKTFKCNICDYETVQSCHLK
jgi:KRAB domain-containing zinc finger protein